MKYNQPHGVADTDAGYVNGNPATGVEGSIPPAAALEAPQREIVSAILGSGQTPSRNDTGQLWKAIQRAGMFHYGAATGTASAIVVATTTPATTTIPSGYTIAIKIAHASAGTGTEQTTISVAGSTPTRATRPDGTNLCTGDLLVGQIAVFTFDGSKWQMVSPNAASFSGGGGGGGGGSPGATGAPGSQIYDGTSDPSGVLGVDGDFFLNTVTGDIFKRASGSWGFLCNLRGSDGTDAVEPSAVTLTTTATLTTAQFNYEVKLSAAGTFTTTLPTPVAKGGVGRFHIYNAASVAMTLATPAGSFVGPHGSGASSMSIPAGSTVFVISDNTNWIAVVTRATATNAYANGNILAAFMTIPSSLDGDDGDFTVIAGSLLGAVDGVYRKAAGAWSKLCSLPLYLTANPARAISGSTAVGSVYCIEGPPPRPPMALSLSSANLNNQGLVLSGGASVGAGAGLPPGTWKIRRVIGLRSAEIMSIAGVSGESVITAICERIA